MTLVELDGCMGPVAIACQATGSVQGAASDYVLGGLGGAFVDGAQQVGQLAMAALDSSTSVDLGVGWFRSNVAVIAAIALPVVVGLFVVQVLTSVLRREPGGLLRGVLGVGKAMLGAGVALGVTQLALTAVDGICGYIASAAGLTVTAAAAQFFEFAALAKLSPSLQILIGLALMLGFVLMWGVLLFRKAALVLVAVFAPIAFAGSAWDQTRVWTRRWIEIVAALVFSKIVIVVAFVVGASAFTGTGPASPGQPATTSGGAGGVAGLSDALVGILLLAIAVWAPWLTWRFVHWSGMEAAGVMHANVAANPLSKVARSSANTTRYAAQQAVMSSVTGGVGTAARAGTATKAATGGPQQPNPMPPQAPKPAVSTRAGGSA